MEQQQQRDVARAQEEQSDAAQGKSKGAFSKLVKVAQKVGTAVEHTAVSLTSKGEASMRGFVEKRDQERFTINFPDIAALGESVVCDYSAKVMHQGQKVGGTFQVTRRFLLFYSDTLREVIPLNEIASIQRSVALETVDNGPPFIMPIPAPHVIADTLQIFTTKQQVFQFMHFDTLAGKAGQALTTSVRGKPIDRAYNFLDHMWRGCVQVPLPGYQYAYY